MHPDETSPAQEQVKPISIGRTVHYVLPDGRSAGQHRPAIVLRVWGEATAWPQTVQLAVFVDGTNDYDTIFGMSSHHVPVIWKTSVSYDADRKLGTWHWPEAV